MLAADEGQCQPARPIDTLVRRKDTIAPTVGATGAPTSRLQTLGYRTRKQTGRRGELEGGVSLRAGGGGAEGCAAIAGGALENATLGKYEDNRARGK